MLVDLHTGLRVTVDRIHSTDEDAWMTIVKLEIPRLCTCQLIMASSGFHEVTLTTRWHDPPVRRIKWFSGEVEQKPAMLKANLLCKRYVGMTFAEAVEAFDELEGKQTVKEMKHG